MGVGFYFRKCRGGLYSSVYLRIQDSSHNVDYRISTGMFVNSAAQEQWERTFGLKIVSCETLLPELEIMSRLKERIEVSLMLGTFRRDRIRELIMEYRFPKSLKMECRLLSETPQEFRPDKTEMKRYIENFIIQIRNGERHSSKGKAYSRGTIDAMAATVGKIEDFWKQKGVSDDFMNIDAVFYREFLCYLKSIGYNLNTIGKTIRYLKVILNSAVEDGYSVNNAFRSKVFSEPRMETDSIYLTKEDLDAIQNLDLSRKERKYALARDLFMIGVWTAQRVSDYNNLTYSNIHEELGGKTIHLTQRKTGKKIIIPCSTALCRILDKYPEKLPHLSEKTFNKCIKTIGKWAGLNDIIPVRKSKGGTIYVENIPKYKLIQSHTARRTGATLMYLSGMNVYDICRITGHSNIKLLEKYIKAGNIDTVRKIKERYRYFD